MFAIASFFTPKRTMPVVPTMSLVLKDDTDQVFVEVGYGFSEARPVEIGFQQGDVSIVESGLKAGDRIVMKGGVLLND
jgi:cobalt-zinc-cadmium efflux system membrane fusion protein